MDLNNLGNGPDSSPNILFKKKRGRPRKDQSQNPDRTVNLLSAMDQIQGHGEHGLENGNHSLKGNAVHHSDDFTVGQKVKGVIEATFDAGYLLSVRIGKSDTSLRGVVYKPGHYNPVSTDTHVAPHIQMMNANVVSFLAGHHTPVHDTYRKGRGRGRSRSRSRPVTYSGKQLQVAPAQPATLLGGRGTLVPIILEPANLSDCVAPAVENPSALFPPAHLAASKARLDNQTKAKLLEKDLACNIEGSAVGFPSAMMEELVNEVVKRIQGSTESKETRKDSEQASGAFTCEQEQDLNEPFLLEPLQIVPANHFNESPSVPQNFGDAKPGKMTELLLLAMETHYELQAATLRKLTVHISFDKAVQENFIDNQAADAQCHVFSGSQN